MRTNLIKNVFFILIFVIVIIFLFLFNIGSNEVVLNISGYEYTFSKSDEIFNINLNTLNSEYKTIIKKDSVFSNVKINGKRFFLKKDMGILNIDEKEKIELEIKFRGKAKYTKYVINTLPKTMPIFECNGYSTTKGDFYFTTYGSGFGETNVGADTYLLKINNKGRILFYKQVGYKSYLFKKHIIDGKIYYSYLDYVGDKGSVGLYILDSKYRVVKEVVNIYDPINSSIDFHDYVVLNLDNYIFSNIDKELTETIYEVKNDSILWKHKWLAEEFLDVNKDKKLAEYHFNSFELDNDNNLLVSFRNSDEVVKLDRKTGDIIWILGGKNNDFDKSIFLKQHSIVRDEDTYMVFNNNGTIIDTFSNNQERKSSIVMFNLEQKNMKVTGFKDYKLDCFSFELASIFPSDPNNNIYVIDYGRSVDKGNKAFEEINLETKQVYFSFNYPDVNSAVYRVYKY